MIRDASRYQRDMGMAHRAMAALPSDALNVDVGAHEGEWLKYFTERSPYAQHVAFEPLPRYVPELRSKFPNCVIHEVALTDSFGASNFEHVVNDPDCSGFFKPERCCVEKPQVETIAVRVMPLDAALRNAPRVNFIKINVRGGEYKVLAGSTKTLERLEPTIYFEHARIHFRNYGETSVPLHDLLTRVGYSIMSLQSKTLMTRVQFIEAVEYAHRINYRFPAETKFIAAPKDHLAHLMP